MIRRNVDILETINFNLNTFFEKFKALAFIDY